MDSNNFFEQASLGLWVTLGLITGVNIRAYIRTFNDLQSGESVEINRMGHEARLGFSPMENFLYYATLPGRELAYRTFEKD